MGRQTLLNEAVEKRVLDGLQSGAHFSDVAKYAGITERTLFRWLERGKKYKDALDNDLPVVEADSQYYEFSQRVSETVGAVRLRMVGRIVQAADGTDGSNPDWKAAAWYLERSSPEHWGRKNVPEAAIAIAEQTNIALMVSEAVALVEQAKQRRLAIEAGEVDTTDIGS
jgi:hypothetical protein